MKDLKQRAIRGGFAKGCGQATKFLIRIGSVMILSRLLEPRDFGLVGMVTAFTGVFGIFMDFGLSAATVQRETITEEQLTALFWTNMLVGVTLASLSLFGAPAVAHFYHEPRLVGVMAVLAAGFVFNAAGVQHSAILERQMRFIALAAIDLFSMIVGIAVGITMALSGLRYWSLVGMTITIPAVSTSCLWMASKWVPGRPRKESGVRPMLKFGGTITLNSLIVYVAYNLEKVLLGRYWGAETVGIYGRAFQLINIPTDNLNSAAGAVAFAALSRLQDDTPRLKKYFLKAYSLILAVTLPIAIICALFADDLILVLLGPKWKDAAILFRLLAPTILAFGLMNPLGWLLVSLGLVQKSLKIALVTAPIVITGCVLGLPYGPKGVAFAYSAVMALWVFPHLAWCVRGTPISFGELLRALSRPLVSAILAGLLSFAVRLFLLQPLSPLPRLIVAGALFGAVYMGILLYVMGQKTLYLGVVRELRKSSSGSEALASV
jgi:PST family polysaccharide transporter